MYLNSINNLHNAVQSTDYYKKKRPSEKPVLLDKCNWFIHSIIQGNRHTWSLSEFQPVPLSQKILKEHLGSNEYLRIKDLLEKEIQFIEVDNNYLPKSLIEGENDKRTATSKKYSLSEKAIKEGTTKVGILSHRMEEKIKKYKVERFHKYNNNTLHRKIIYSITQLHFNPAHPKALEALNGNEAGTEQDKYFRETYTELQELNVYTNTSHYAESDYFYYMQSQKVGRVFHTYATIPKKFRWSLSLKNGKKLSEIDLRNSQPLIIGLNYLNSRMSHSLSDRNLLEDILGGKFYEKVALQAKNNGDIQKYHLFTENYGEFKKQVLRQGLYFNYIPELDKIKPIERYLMELYPQFMRYVRSKKLSECMAIAKIQGKKIGFQEGFKIISLEAQKIESSIFIDGIFSRLEYGKDIVVPVHDALLVETEKVDQYLEMLIESFSGKFPLLSYSQVRNLFRITHQ